MVRKNIKRFLYGRCPGFAGAFPYFGVKVHFPPRSWSFYAACEQGIFEHDNVSILQSLMQPDTMMFDVGANIGLMAIPVLKACCDCRVISFEPSANVLPSLRRTVAGSPFGSRWELIEKAVGSAEGIADFAISSQAESLFDGFRNTKRASTSSNVTVPVTTLDATWRMLGRPAVSVIKCDVEGADFDVLAGARECLAATGAAILTEWNATNLAIYERPPATLLEFARSTGYRLFSVPGFVEIGDPSALRLHMIKTESFLLTR
jgi:FkbM family methyltransferase